jgi:hypothetical protein
MKPQHYQKLNLWQRIEKLYKKKLEYAEPQKKVIVEKWICETTTKIQSIKSETYAENTIN